MQLFVPQQSNYPFIALSCHTEQKGYEECSLWNKLTLPFKSNGYSSSQTPAKDDDSISWLDDDKDCPIEERLRNRRMNRTRTRDESELHVLAHSSDGMCIITNCIKPTFTSLYISHMPEYESLKRSHDDAQFIYNAIMFLCEQTTTHSLRQFCITSMATTLFNKSFSNREALQTIPIDIQVRLCQAALKSGQTKKKVTEAFGSPLVAEAVAVSKASRSPKHLTREE